MTAPRELETDQLAELIGQKHQALVQLRDLARRQSGLIAGEEMAQLLTLLAAKQKLLTQVQAMDRGLDPFRQQEPEQRTWRSPELRQQVAQTASRSESLLAEIMAIEKQSETEMVDRRDKAANQLQTATHAANVRNAYFREAAQQRNRLDVTQ